MIQTLIDKQDNFEIVRDEIAAILLTESANQQALATADGKDPALWNLRVFKERANPWEAALNEQNTATLTPIINVAYDSSSFERRSSNTFERQTADGVFNIDCYGFATSESDGAGHKAGDKGAALEAQRAIRLVRNILMASEYYKLKLRGLVGDEWIQSVTMFQPQLDARNIPNVHAGRIALAVKFNEFSPQYVAQTLELVSVVVDEQESGELLLQADYQYPLT